METGRLRSRPDRLAAMCGIAGYAGLNDPALLERMASRMVHRGPDDSGCWADQSAGIGLAHRRLSIIDLSPAGRQPMATGDGLVVISFNGEIYDYLEHRLELEKQGVRFRTRTDTEVILRLYERYGAGAISKLNGMFAFALWDGRARKLLLVRDHAGIKPLYYWTDGTRLLFASEIKALLASTLIPRRPNLSALESYLGFLWVPGDQTMLEGVKKLEPGHYLEWQAGRMTTQRWFDLDYSPDTSVGEAEWTDRVRETFIRTARRQMVSDVPLGAFLSGGLDSSSIVACMRAAYPDRAIKAYTARFSVGQMASEQGVDDLPFAREAAARLNVSLHEVAIEPDVVSLLPRMVYHLDEPDADPAIFPSYLITEAARRDGSTVLLSGTGGDEVFFGYRSHQAMQRYALLDRDPTGLVAGSLGLVTAVGQQLLGRQNRLVRRATKFMRGLRAAPGVQRHLELVDWSEPGVRSRLLTGQAGSGHGGERSLEQAINRYASTFHGQGAINQHSHILINTFLAAHNFLYTDKSSMASSVEVRVPFLDLDLLRLAATIPESFKVRGRTTKYVLKKAMEPYLPRDVIYRAKTGFGVPLRHWIQTDLRGAVRDLLGPATVRQRGLFSAPEVERVLRQNDAGQGDHAYLIYALMVLEVWMQTFVDRPGEMVGL
ncbi:MAG: asparagine synthase (glutamine-hydrolyzing) [Chromatiales bacterium]|nr:asparagine synthase (glutamine-hydrolyzing) [Chromatiales bacterium]